ncbi:MAG: UvrD-helicase domain-containing protein [Neisseriaceae bacterium]|nr:UvrD-helicase domain-containing protein [Neisseriaceae bacterium]
MQNALSLLNNLNPEQLRAVTFPNESALILAGAGSGKTRVLTTRIAWLLATGNVSPHAVLAVTFTNKAAKEMAHRLSAMVSANVRSMWLGTFHGLCCRFLRIHHKDAGLPENFRILDSADQLSVIKRLLKEWNIAESYIAPKALQGFINSHKENGLRANSITAKDEYHRHLIECFAGYDTRCCEEGVVDFAELLLRCYEVLQVNEPLRHHYQQRFRHILIDEFQDTNKLQYAWIKLLAAGGAAVFAVGDDDQSIYRFRGANVGNMSALLKDFSISEPIKLEQNYRSVGNILNAANALISHNKNRLGKNLRTDRDNGDKIRFFSAENDYGEAHFVIDEIKELHRNGLNYNEIAILYRNNAQSRVIEQELFAANVPYRIYGGLRFYERQEIKHALAYLRLAVNHFDNDAFLRIINIPPRGIGAKTVENIQSVAVEERISYFQAACNMATRSPKIAAFIKIINELSTQSNSFRLPEIVQLAIDKSQLIEYYQNQKTDQHERIDNLEELINAANAFRAEESGFMAIDNPTPVAILSAFLSNASLEAGEHQAGESLDAVQLMTIHAAKGLEFDTVFLTGAEEGLFPSEYAMAEQGGEEEERRLMYVAMTRAKKKLFISSTQYRLLHGQSIYPVVSRFIDEIPTEFIHALSPKQNKEKVRQVNDFIQNNNKSFDGFFIGENIRHEKFGTGVIINAIQKTDGSTNLLINFGSSGIKELNTFFAKDKLTKL